MRIGLPERLGGVVSIHLIEVKEARAEEVMMSCSVSNWTIHAANIKENEEGLEVTKRPGA